MSYDLTSLFELYTHYHKGMEFKGKPTSLYDSMNYIMDLGGKRARPLLTLASCYAVNQTPETALSLAWAVETFHNFSLVHDDIMDNADVRRGQPTVHKKFDTNTAILCGDNLLVKVFTHLAENNSKQVQLLFAKTASEICDGQQLDMEYAQKDRVLFEDYLEMIKLKTAVLLGCSAQGGALCAGAETSQSALFYDFAISLGLAFQMEDDLLDTFGNEQLTGKKTGGDILEGKKNALYILSRQVSEEIEGIYKEPEETTRINKAIALYQSQNIEKELRTIINDFETSYQKKLQQIAESGFNTSLLEQLCALLSNRKS